MVKEIVQAVHPVDVRSFFEGLNLAGNLDARRISCHRCGDVITVDNFRAATRQNGKLMFACNKDECVIALATLET
jgi:hypothetical protein